MNLGSNSASYGILPAYGGGYSVQTGWNGSFRIDETANSLGRLLPFSSFRATSLKFCL